MRCGPYTICIDVERLHGRKMLSVEPTIDPSAKLHDTRLGAYCEVGARTILHEVTMDDITPTS